MFKKIPMFGVLCCILVLTSLLCACTSSPGTYKQISQDEALQIMESETGYIVLDVRTPAEFAQGHIPDAINIAVADITDVPPAELSDKDQLIMVYCRSGNRSKVAAQRLADMGYSNVVEFGGINTWNGPVTSDET